MTTTHVPLLSDLHKTNLQRIETVPDSRCRGFSNSVVGEATEENRRDFKV